MTDHFALLDEPRRPWLEPEALKQKFLTLSAQFHPDRVHHQGESERHSAQNRYTDLNMAYHCLREPKDRLRHLLELELGAAPTEVQRIPPDLVELFMEIGPACRQADLLLGEKDTISSPLLKVQWFQRSQDWRENLQHLRQKLDERSDRLMEGLKRIDLEWKSGTAIPSKKAVLLNQLEDVCRLLSYFERWRKQLQERMVQLSF
jgi:curved DNA-binding protein CbpA